MNVPSFIKGSIKTTAAGLLGFWFDFCSAMNNKPGRAFE